MKDQRQRLNRKQKEMKSKNDFAKNKISKIGMLCLAGAFVLCILIIMFSATKTTYTVTVGEIANSTVTAPWDITDDVSTNSLIEEEKAKVVPIYSIDKTATDSILTGIDAELQQIHQCADQAHQTYVSSEIERLQAEENKRAKDETDKKQREANAATPEGMTPATVEEVVPKTITADDVEFSVAEIDWKSALGEEQINSIKSLIPSYYSEEDFIKIVSAEDGVLAAVTELVKSKASEMLASGIKDDNLEISKQLLSAEIKNETDSLGFDADYSFISKTAVNNLSSNMIFDEAATKAAQDEAAASVAPVEYKQGQNIIVKGEVVSQAQYSVLEKTGLINQTMDLSQYIPMVVYLLLIFVIYCIYMFMFDREIAESTKKLLILSILFVLAVVFCVITNRIAPNIYMVFSIAIIAASIVSVRHSIAFSVFLAFFLITVSSDTFMFFSESALRTIVISVTGCILSVLMISKFSFRASPLLAGLISAVPCFIIYIMMVLMGTITSNQFGSMFLWSLFGGVFCGIVSIGLLPLFEIIFKILTPAKLVELADPRRKLLKRLMIEAPGTYHHSLYVGNLAENACDAIGADALLARVGAYYHDIGKLKNPEYFVENQRNGINPHDDITPEESAEIITSHVYYGRELAEKENLPIELINIIYEHHGNTKVAFFLHKAKTEGQEFDEDIFRYHAPRPTTKESAIIMLADSVEAAMHTVSDPTEEQVLETIRKIIRAKYNDGQLDFTPVTLKDLDLVAQAFAEAYKGKVHSRIEYPEEKK